VVVVVVMMMMMMMMMMAMMMMMTARATHPTAVVALVDAGRGQDLVHRERQRAPNDYIISR
jgi:hypothetical protein